MQIAWFAYLHLYEERNRAEHCEKLLLKFNKYCLPELQWCSFAFSLSFKILPRLGTRGESRAERLTESGHTLRALVASKFHIGPQQRTFTLQMCTKFEQEAWATKLSCKVVVTTRTKKPLCLFRYASNGGGAWVECKGTRHPTSAVEWPRRAKAGT